MREHLLDRIAVTLSADVPNTFDERVRAIDAAMKFQDRRDEVMADTEELTEALKTSVRRAGPFLIYSFHAQAGEGMR